jgi:hypothetical protein
MQRHSDNFTQKSSFNILDLLTLPPLERSIMLHLIRNGEVDAHALAESIPADLVSLETALSLLIETNRISILPTGQYTVLLGWKKPKTKLPSQLWSAILTGGRTYSTREVATLRTVIPMLQFARARLSEFADHGPGHALRVKSFATQLSYILDIKEAERFQLRISALFHDIGNVIDRKTHNIISQETVVDLANSGELPIDLQEAQIIGQICRWHRKSYDPEWVDKLNGKKIRTGFLASVLRVCDAMDIDHRRSDYDEKFRRVLAFFYPQELPYWTSLEVILGVRIRCTPDVQIQVFTKGQIGENMQIEMLEDDLASTPLGWEVHRIAVEEKPIPKTERSGKALLVFPFEANSIIMAALSRNNLIADGLDVALLCYPDTIDGPLWLWSEGLPNISAGDFQHLIVIGDRHSGKALPSILNTIQKWQAAGVSVTILNRHEANWSRIPQLLEMGVDLTLGGDWAYFYGDSGTPQDFLWAHIGALCTRDPTQASFDISPQEENLTRGLLAVIYENQSTGREIDDTTEWNSLAEFTLDKIASNDLEYFENQADQFDRFRQPMGPYDRNGKVIIFNDVPSEISQAYYWVLENVIEQEGLFLRRGVQFKVPYALAYWFVGEEIELLAINHWREEEAVPIRFLFPEGTGISPQGNESTIHLRMAVHQAEAVIPRLIEACNRQEALCSQNKYEKFMDRVT